MVSSWSGGTPSWRPRLHHLAVTGSFVSFAKSAIGTACREELTKVNKKDVHSQPVADTHGDQNPTNTLLSISSNLVIQCTKEAVNYKIWAVSYKMSFSVQMDDRVLTRINTKYTPPSYRHMNIIVLAQRLHDSSEKASQFPCWNQPVLLELVLSSEHNRWWTRREEVGQKRLDPTSPTFQR